MRLLGGIEDRYQADYLGALQILSKGQTISYEFGISFAGAKVLTMIDAYSEELAIPNFDLAIDFGFGSIFGDKAIFLCDQLAE